MRSACRILRGGSLHPRDGKSGPTSTYAAAEQRVSAAMIMSSADVVQVRACLACLALDPSPLLTLCSP
eukprot:6954217-Prymnesium_polylepis.1